MDAYRNEQAFEAEIRALRAIEPGRFSDVRLTPLLRREREAAS